MRTSTELCPHALKLSGDVFRESHAPRCNTNTVPVPSTQTITLAAKVKLCYFFFFFPIPRLLETTNLQRRSIQMSSWRGPCCYLARKTTLAWLPNKTNWHFVMAGARLQGDQGSQRAQVGT